MKSYNLEDYFDIGVKDNNLVYLMNKTIYIKDDINPQYYTTRQWQDGDTWFLLSYLEYNTIDLWWLICKVNNITSPIISPEPGTPIKLLKKDIVEQILDMI